MSSLSAKIQDVFNEPGCGKNANKSEAERKKGCTKQLQPGVAAAPSTAPRSRCSP
jgi:nitrogenase molybdenum-cofactor synthesis protein NifE